jgi:hypothetical protein
MEKPTSMVWSRRPPARSGVRAAHYVSLVVAFLLLVVVTRKQWFWYDEWDFLTRGFAGRPLDLLVPHNEHWSTIPLLTYRAIFSVFGLRSYLPYIGVLLIAHVSVAHLLWRLMLRSEVEPWVATTASALFLVLGAAYENIVWAFQIGFVGSFAFGLGAVLVVDRNRSGSRRGTVLTWVLLVASLMCSDVGVPMVAVAALTAFFSRNLRTGMVTLSVPTAVFLVWFLTYGDHAVGAQVTSLQTLEGLPEFIWLGMTSALDGLAGFAGVGAVAMAGLVVWLTLRRHETKTHPVAFAGAFGAVVYFAVVGAGRAASLGEAGAPRHVYAAALLLPVVGWAVSDLARRDVLAQIAVCAVVAFCASLGFGQLLANTRDGLSNAFERYPQGQSEHQILAAAALLGAGLQPIGTQPDPAAAPYLSVSELEGMARAGDLPSGIALSPTDILSARSALETSLSGGPMFGVGTARLAGTAGALVTPGADGCIHLQSLPDLPLALRLVFTSSASISLESPVPVVLKYFLQINDDERVTANPLRLALAADEATYLNVDIGNATPYIVSPVSLTICGAASATP